MLILARLAFTDPRLSWALLTGPVLPAQYRLHGPGAWPGARHVVLSVWDSLTCQLKTRKVPPATGFPVDMLRMKIILLCVVVLAIVYTFT